MMAGIEGKQTRRPPWAISVTPANKSPKMPVIRWYRNSAATASAAAFTEEPQVLHHYRKGQGMELKPGMIFTVEPMINQGKRHLRILADGWTVVTKDRSLSAQMGTRSAGNRYRLRDFHHQLGQRPALNSLHWYCTKIVGICIHIPTIYYIKLQSRYLLPHPANHSNPLHSIN